MATRQAGRDCRTAEQCRQEELPEPKTVQVVQMDYQVAQHLQPRRCIGVHSSEGRREVRALAFTSTGSALLAAYPDGLRTFTLDPLELRDTAELQWRQVGLGGINRVALPVLPVVVKEPPSFSARRSPAFATLMARP